jgi:L-lysine exporter family protein LysE/ArgO
MNTFFSGFLLSLSLIVAIGPQNAHVLRMGLMRAHVAITIAACVASDALLIAIGVLGLAQLGEFSAGISQILMGAAVLFLLHYGWLAARRAAHPAPQGLQATSPTALPTAPPTQAQALSSALAFAWLNPHAWIDTAVIIGTASMAYNEPHHLVFGAGAIAGSTVWFIGLGVGAAALAQRLSHPSVWRILDGLIAITMWGTAAWLGRSVWLAAG